MSSIRPVVHRWSGLELIDSTVSTDPLISAATTPRVAGLDTQSEGRDVGRSTPEVRHEIPLSQPHARRE